jgi:hypothetical protein
MGVAENTKFRERFGEYPDTGAAHRLQGSGGDETPRT